MVRVEMSRPLLQNRYFSPGFGKKSVQFFVRDSASFYGVAKGRENLVEGAFAFHISLDEFFHVTLNITAFGPGALFEKRFNFWFKFQCYCHRQTPWARRFFLHSEIFFNRRRNSASGIPLSRVSSWLRPESQPDTCSSCLNSAVIIIRSRLNIKG